MKLEIKVPGLLLKPINEFEEFQGSLKSTTREKIDKLKKSIRRLGIIMPIFIWKKSILDGHQRIAAVKELIDEGDILEKNQLPYLEIKAKDKKQAAEILLAYSSEYARITRQGLHEFMDEFKLDKQQLQEFTELNASFEELSDGEKEFDHDIQVTHKCPKCGFEY